MYIVHNKIEMYTLHNSLKERAVWKQSRGRVKAVPKLFRFEEKCGIINRRTACSYDLQAAQKWLSRSDMDVDPA